MIYKIYRVCIQYTYTKCDSSQSYLVVSKNCAVALLNVVCWKMLPVNGVASIMILVCLIIAVSQVDCVSKIMKNMMKSLDEEVTIVPTEVHPDQLRDVRNVAPQFLSRECRDWSSLLNLAAHPCGPPGSGNIKVKPKQEENLENSDERKKIFDEIYNKSGW